MTDQITVPKQTWDAMRAALQAVRPADSLSDSRLRLVLRELADLTAANAVSEQPKPVALQWVAEMIMSDCGCSTNNERLLERVIGRIEQYEWANGPAHPQATEPAEKEWISVDDQMPPPMERVLASEPRHRTVKVDMWFGTDFQWGYTHWMPLPAAPEAKQ